MIYVDGFHKTEAEYFVIYVVRNFNINSPVFLYSSKNHELKQTTNMNMF